MLQYLAFPCHLLHLIHLISLCILNPLHTDEHGFHRLYACHEVVGLVRIRTQGKECADDKGEQEATDGNQHGITPILICPLVSLGYPLTDFPFHKEPPKQNPETPGSPRLLLGFLVFPKQFHSHQ